MATYNEVSQLILDLLPTGNQIRSVDHRTVEQAILDFAKSQWVTGDVKEVDCTNQYIIDNFESDGMGKNERVGWAICNGNNGTRNRTGRVSVAYGTTPLSGASPFTVMGTSSSPTVGGSEDAAVLDHFHEYQDAYFAEIGGHKPIGSVGGSGNTDSDNGFYYRTRNGNASATPPAAGNRPVTDNPYYSQGTGENKNMQPYIVTLFIQKI